MQPSRLLLAACVALALLSCVCVAQIDKSDKASPEQSLFRSLYTKIEEMVLPPYNSERGAPNAVILFEMPGLAINRDEYDTNIWAAGGFNSRQPEAVAASFVDRLPYYTGATFVDSGSRISAVWSNFIYQYIIPIVDDPIQVQKVNEARGALANGTLTNTYNAASASYQATFSQFVTFRSNCLARQPGGVCSAEGVIYRELLKRKWFSLEVARRDIAAAEAKIIALQVQDLKNIFADALYAFASNERVDMGGAGFGTNYYLTFLTPSNFWRWWPTTGIYDHSVYADGSTVAFTLEPGASIVRNPVFGALTTLVNGSYSYRPNAGYTGSDTYVYQVTKPVGGTNVTSTITRSIQVIGNDVLAADTAFVSVTATASYTEQTDKSFSSSLSTSSSFRAGFGMFSASGSLSTSSTSTETSSESLARDSSISFDLAKVSISRPWLDISLLSFYPVAIRNLVAQGWSDGTLTPASSATRFKFKLLPTAFLVARKIVIKSSFSQKMQQLNQQASSLDASLKVSVGPFFSGSTSVSSDSASREYKESSTTTAGSVSIRGPQVIGWLCTPVPPFPTSDEAGVRKWEADQIARQDAANKSTASGSSSGTGTTTTTAAGTTTAGTTATTAGTTNTPATATATR